jgi:hypothetical protein
MIRVSYGRGFIGLTCAALALLACQDNAERVSYAPQPAASGSAASAQREAPDTRAATSRTQHEPATMPSHSGSGLDHDGDGIPSSDDRCPTDPEDRDGFEDSDGCPDPDNDHDGVRDVDDLCPNDAEDRDGVQDDDGCPERP